jgi:hypothetical protein
MKMWVDLCFIFFTFSQSGELSCLGDAGQNVRVSVSDRGRKVNPGRRRTCRPAAGSGSLRNPSQPLRSIGKTPRDEVSWQFFFAYNDARRCAGVNRLSREAPNQRLAQLVPPAATWFQKNPREGFKSFSRTADGSMQEARRGGN